MCKTDGAKRGLVEEELGVSGIGTVQEVLSACRTDSSLMGVRLRVAESKTSRSQVPRGGVAF